MYDTIHYYEIFYQLSCKFWRCGNCGLCSCYMYCVFWCVVTGSVYCVYLNSACIMWRKTQPGWPGPFSCTYTLVAPKWLPSCRNAARRERGGVGSDRPQPGRGVIDNYLALTSLHHRTWGRGSPHQPKPQSQHQTVWPQSSTVTKSGLGLVLF